MLLASLEFNVPNDRTVLATVIFSLTALDDMSMRSIIACLSCENKLMQF